MKKLIILILSLIISCHANASEIITGFDNDKDLPVLNDELRQIDDDINSIDSRVETLEAEVDEVGAVYQTVSSTYYTAGSVGANITLDTDPFTTSEGAEILSVAITPNSLTNKLKFFIDISGACSGGSTYIVGLFSNKSDYGTTANAIKVAGQEATSDADILNIHFQFSVDVQTTDATTFTVRYGTHSGTAYVNRTNSVASGLLDGKLGSTITIFETSN